MMKGWTLFLDRDGVVNENAPNRGYVRRWSQFKFIPGFLEDIRELSKLFGRIVIVTNQRGVGRGMMSEKTLVSIHKKMVARIKRAGGRIDAVYYCPHDIKDGCNCRKPKVGMALAAKADFPKINFKKSVMIGDSKRDIQFGKRLGMKTIKIG